MASEVEERRAWGEGHGFSLMDRFGVWLSTRMIRRRVGPFAGKDVADIGCGYQAVFMRGIIPEVGTATLVDLAISDELKAMPNVRAHEGLLPEILEQIPDQSLDVVISNNVLEHLWEPARAVSHIRRVLRKGGKCFLNVPSWSGKVALETAAFRLGMTSKEQIDDHKHYFDKRQLWNLLVKGGFKPSEISCRTHKFGLNTYAFCTVTTVT